MQKHLLPIGLPRQGSGESALHFYPLNLIGKPGLSGFGIPPGQVQPEERGTGPGQQGKASSLRGAEAQKKTLDFCKGWMLGKDDAFEVVLDPATDPGADKRGLL